MVKVSGLDESVVSEIVSKLNEVEVLQAQLLANDGRSSKTFNLVQDYHKTSSELTSLLTKHDPKGIYGDVIAAAALSVGHVHTKLTKTQSVKLRRVLLTITPVLKMLRK